MLRGDTKYGDALKKAATAFAGVLAGSDIPAANKTAITQKLAAYQRDFLAYMDGTQTQANETKALSDAYAKFDPQIVAIEKAIEKIEEEATTATKATVAATTLQIQIGILAITIGVILLAFFIGRAISKPIGKMLRCDNELANGNKAVEIPYTGREATRSAKTRERPRRSRKTCCAWRKWKRSRRKPNCAPLPSAKRRWPRWPASSRRRSAASSRRRWPATSPSASISKARADLCSMSAARSIRCARTWPRRSTISCRCSTRWPKAS